MGITCITAVIPIIEELPTILNKVTKKQYVRRYSQIDNMYAVQGILVSRKD